MNEEKKDPQLGTPQEANTGKHINFRELQDVDNSRSPGSDNEADDSPTKKAWKELREETKEELSENNDQ
jgi:hypothetical protein